MSDRCEHCGTEIVWVMHGTARVAVTARVLQLYVERGGVVEVVRGRAPHVCAATAQVPPPPRRRRRFAKLVKCARCGSRFRLGAVGSRFMSGHDFCSGECLQGWESGDA